MNYNGDFPPTPYSRRKAMSIEINPELKPQFINTRRLKFPGQNNCNQSPTAKEFYPEE
jgi:hypothetical protein